MHVSVEGRRLHCIRRGAGEPMLMIMGMSGTHLSWGEPFLRELERDYEVIVYDHRSTGHSDPTHDPFSIADLADDAAGLLEALELPAAHVVGISMGGMVAQELVLRHPERVWTLALGCTFPGGERTARTSPEVIQRLVASMASGDRELAIRTGWEVNVSRAYAQDAGKWETFREMATTLPVAVEVIMAQMQAIMGHDTVSRLDQVEAPTLVIHGTDDEMVPVQNAHLLAELIPHARLEILDGVGHLFFWEQPERSAELVRETAARAGARAQ